MNKPENPDKDVKQFMGMPMRWDYKNMLKGLWDADDDRIFPPKHFGIGWSLNAHALLRKINLIKNKKPR